MILENVSNAIQQKRVAITPNIIRRYVLFIRKNTQQSTQPQNASSNSKDGREKRNSR